MYQDKSIYSLALPPHHSNSKTSSLQTQTLLKAKANVFHTCEKGNNQGKNIASSAIATRPLCCEWNKILPTWNIITDKYISLTPK